MRVLREDLHEGIGGQTAADIGEVEMSFGFAFNPEIDASHFVPAIDDGLVEFELTIKFEGAGLNGHGAGGQAWSFVFVDDADPDAELGQPQCQNQTRRTRSCNQNIAFHGVASLVLTRGG